MHIHRVEPGNQSKIQWTDLLVDPGNTYSYYVVALHPEILIDGKPIQSPPTSAQTVTIPHGLESQEDSIYQTEENYQREQISKERRKFKRKKIKMKAQKKIGYHSRFTSTSCISSRVTALKAVILQLRAFSSFSFANSLFPC